MGCSPGGVLETVTEVIQWDPLTLWSPPDKVSACRLGRHQLTVGSSSSFPRVPPSDEPVASSVSDLRRLGPWSPGALLSAGFFSSSFQSWVWSGDACLGMSKHAVGAAL